MKGLAVIAFIGILFARTGLQVFFWLAVLIVSGVVAAWRETKLVRPGETYREYQNRIFMERAEMMRLAQDHDRVARVLAQAGAQKQDRAETAAFMAAQGYRWEGDPETGRWVFRGAAVRGARAVLAQLTRIADQGDLK